MRKGRKNQVLGGKATLGSNPWLGRGLLRPYSIIQSLLTRTSLSNAHCMSALFAPGIQWQGIVALSSILVFLSLVFHLRLKGCIYQPSTYTTWRILRAFPPSKPKAKEQKEKKNKKQDEQGRDPPCKRQNVQLPDYLMASN
ncbi:uncharacterized protein TrAtP1_000903 [Trichoderma atroviride]|uniref:uncharacterized protein n=1 Tax=Hypocrea atroviridis TaxID=63577 RepID=UPI00332088A2|nr:hypothetical protein TrAtP1_000903 [Trichoderma atroviride]